MSLLSRLSPYFREASGESWALGITLGSLHLIASLWVISHVASATPAGWWQFAWLPFAIADVPLTVVLFPVGQLFRETTIGGLPYPLGRVSDFLIPAVTHGLLGPALYLLTPPYLVSRFHSRRHARGPTS
jgi:hypothetical protein